MTLINQVATLMANQPTYESELIEQQAARIAELEAERDGWREDANISRNSIAMLKDRCGHFEDTLAALRRKIDEAPVVAWWYPKAGKAIAAGRLYWDDRMEMTEAGTKLISKEDLQK